MANLIRLKQIESGDNLAIAATVGADFSASVNSVVSESLQTTFSASIVNIITNNVAAVLPDGVVSSSAQITLLDASGYNEFVATLDINGIATDTELRTTSSQIIDQGEW